ncbi:SRPBCC family protein [Georgenia halophila]|uniref:SRPBCC family protein n=1 Tax=Georgenia halophila TaxID=620889 RepID=A0ABP8LF90_9MICO
MNGPSTKSTRATAGSAPLSQLKDSASGYATALGGRFVDKLTDKVSGLSDRLQNYAEGTAGSGATSAMQEGAEKLAQGESPVKAGLAGAATGVKETVKNAFGGGGGAGGGGKKFKFNNIVESFDVGAPVDVVYNAWTEYDGWPDFMKKLEHAELDEDRGKVTFKGQVFWSHRQWETTIKNQVPGKRIVWDSTGAKGHISGVVTFHALGEDLTRIVLVAEYHPQGFVEKTGNIWRAANRRIRLELKFFVRHVMTDVVLHPEDSEGYRAEIQDKEITRSHDEVVEEEQQAGDAGGESSGERPSGEERGGQEQGQEQDEGPQDDGEEAAEDPAEGAAEGTDEEYEVGDNEESTKESS